MAYETFSCLEPIAPGSGAEHYDALRLYSQSEHHTIRTTRKQLFLTVQAFLINFSVFDGNN